MNGQQKISPDNGFGGTETDTCGNGTVDQEGSTRARMYTAQRKHMDAASCAIRRTGTEKNRDR